MKMLWHAKKYRYRVLIQGRIIIVLVLKGGGRSKENSRNERTHRRFGTQGDRQDAGPHRRRQQELQTAGMQHGKFDLRCYTRLRKIFNWRWIEKLVIQLRRKKNYFWRLTRFDSLSTVRRGIFEHWRLDGHRHRNPEQWQYQIVDYPSEERRSN